MMTRLRQDLAARLRAFIILPLMPERPCFPSFLRNVDIHALMSRATPVMTRFCASDMLPSRHAGMAHAPRRPQPRTMLRRCRAICRRCQRPGDGEQTVQDDKIMMAAAAPPPSRCRQPQISSSESFRGHSFGEEEHSLPFIAALPYGADTRHLPPKTTCRYFHGI